MGQIASTNMEPREVFQKWMLSLQSAGRMPGASKEIREKAWTDEYDPGEGDAIIPASSDLSL